MPKDLERIQGLLRGAERLRAVMGQRRAEMERESGQLDVYISALEKAAFFITGYDTSSGTVAGLEAHYLGEWGVGAGRDVCDGVGG